MLLLYTQNLSKVIDQSRELVNNSNSKGLKLLARALLMSEIILKLIQRSHQFVPEYFRFARTAIELSLNLGSKIT